MDQTVYRQVDRMADLEVMEHLLRLVEERAALLARLAVE